MFVISLALDARLTRQISEDRLYIMTIHMENEVLLYWRQS